MQRTLDLLIKSHEMRGISREKLPEENVAYPAYMSDAEWERFVDEMRTYYPLAYKRFGAGSGGEMKPRKNGPPKMASYGSSSRFIYKYCRDFDGFIFEYKLYTRVGGTANLDGHLLRDGKEFFVEAKCREPYGSSTETIHIVYRKLYEHISDSDCGLKIKITELGEKMSCVFTAGDMVISTFDIKQMICHLLGIAYRRLTKPRDEKIQFLYFCYNPTALLRIGEPKHQELLSTYERMREECAAIDFKALFSAVAGYLKKRYSPPLADSESIEALASKFSFTLTDQDNITDCLGG